MTDIEPVPAATVALLRGTERDGGMEVLLLRRSADLAFHGGCWVFPGGRIDAEDYGEDRLEYPAARRAAVRETREEAGIEIRPRQLVHTAHWTTPPRLPRRFSTWFFACAVDRGARAVVDNREILDHRWLAPARALAEAEAGALALPGPTRSTLEELARHRDLASLARTVRRDGVRVFPENSRWYRPREMGCWDGRPPRLLSGPGRWDS